HFHGAAAVDVNGRVWTMGGTEGGESGMGNIDYYATPQKILVDSLGNTFDSVAVTVAIEQSNGDNLDQNGYLAVKSTGTLWIWGTVGAMLGNGTDNPSQKILRPLRINMPGGRLIKQMIGGNYCIALCTDETVWTWGNVYKADLGYDPVGLEYT
ncbi:hypothetical protein RXR88_28965, partial [Pseudomonas aeruginosa]|nr:hypothetical protein [Pseudomonas aeruginosa]